MTIANQSHVAPLHQAESEDPPRPAARRWDVGRGLALVITLMILSTVAAWLVGSRQPVLYQAHALHAVVPVANVQLDSGDLIRSLETLERRTLVATLAHLPSTPELILRASTDADPQATAAWITRYHARGAVVPNTNLIRIEVEGPDASLTAELANRIAELTSQRTREMYRIYELEPVAAAAIPLRPSEPRMERFLVLGALIGLFVGLAIFALSSRRVA